MNCQKCGSGIPDKAKFCPKCGSPATLKDEQRGLTMTCPRCGAENPATAKFCKVDGHDLRKAGTDVADSGIAGKAERVCPTCGTVNHAAAKFCRKDGTPLGGEPEIPATGPMPADAPAPEAMPESPEKTGGVRDEAEDEELAPEPGPAKDAKNDRLLCPVCGAENKPTARFCRLDGTPLVATGAKDTDTSAGVMRSADLNREGKGPQSIKAKPKINKKRSGKWRWALSIAAMLIILAGAVTAYLYYAGYIWKSPSEVAHELNTELASKGYRTTAVVDKHWTATLRGTVRSTGEKEAVMGIARARKDIKNIVEAIQVERSPAEVEKLINEEFAKSGLSDVRIQVDPAFIGTLSGAVESQYDRDRAVSAAKTYGELKEIRDNTQIKEQPMLSPPVRDLSPARPPQRVTTKTTPPPRPSTQDPARDGGIILSERNDRILYTDKRVYSPGEPIKVNYSQAPGAARDWICVIPAGAPDTRGGDYKYIPQGSTNGVLTFNAPAPGKYEARAYYNYRLNGYVVSARYSFSVGR